MYELTGEEDMMKRIFALVLTICLLATACCVTAFAANAPAEGVVLRVSGEKSDGTIVTVADYRDHTKGWDAATALANSGKDMKKNDFRQVVVELYADWISAGGFWDAVRFPEGTRITLNLNGHTIHRGLEDWQYNGEVVCVEEKAQVVIQDGTITGGFNCGGAGGIYIHDDANVVLNNVNVVGNTVMDDKGSAIAVYNGATLTMNGGCLSSNVLNAYPSSYAWTEGALYVADATAVLSNVVISGNRFDNYGSEGVAVSVNGTGTVTLNACTVEDNGKNEGSGANSIFYTHSKDSVLILNNTVIRNNGIAFTGANGMPSALFEMHGTLMMSGCTVLGNTPAAIFRVWGNCASVVADISNCEFTDNPSAVFSYPGDVESYGRAQYNLINCRFRNPETAAAYVFKGASLADITLTDCNLGNATVENRGRVKVMASDGAMTGTMLGEGSLSMVASLAALAISVAALGVAIASGKKKDAAKSSDEA